MLKPKRRSLRCSFCSKRDSEVEKLLGGPKTFICDACVGVCNKVLDATPQRFAGWARMTDEQLLGCLAPSSAALEGVRTVLQEQIETLRRREVSWAAIGKA